MEIPPPPPPSDDVPPPPPPSDDVPPPPPPPSSEAEAEAPFAKKRKLGWANGARKQPLDLEELLAKKKAADIAAAKPRYIPRKERERMALEQREKEAAATNGHADRVPPTGPAAMRPLASKGWSIAPPPPPNSDSTARGSKSSQAAAQEAAEAELIRQRYMGPDTNTSTFSAHKKRKRTTEKKFNFEWSAEEDTSQDHHPIYSSRMEVSSVFGRGKLGGYDEDDESAAEAYARDMERLDPEHGKERAAAFLEMQQRARAARDNKGLFKHWSDKRLDQMRERDWRIFKEDFNIATRGGNLPNPMRSWQESGLPKPLLDIVDHVGYTEPSAVQRAAIPVALQSRDLIGVAVTGSGKTAAFLLPLLVYIRELPTLDEMTKNDGPYALILAPTRELAQQIEGETNKFANPLGLTCVSLVGGRSIEEQSYNMRNGAEIIIATPGRLVDCIERRVLVLSQCCYVIMDEADKMIDMGFEEPVNKILDALPVSNQKPDTDAAESASAMSRHLGGSRGRYRQTMMYTATMPAAVERIAKKYLRRPATVTIGNVGEAVDTVEQRVEFVAGEDKRKKRLNEILNSREFAAPIIVFVNIKRNCDAVARDIQKMGLSSVTLHGSKTQDQREAALASLRTGNTEVLVATDLAGRGIDVPDVSLVVNFNMATNIESYTHRIGRTGRAGKTGVAITFLGNEDADVLYDLKQMIGKSDISRMSDELRKHPAAQQKGKKGKGFEESGGFGGKGGWG